MLILAKSLKEIRFAELMEVYSDSVAEAASQWKELPAGLAQQLAEQDQYQYLREVFFPTEEAVCAIWEEKEKYVAALRLEPYRDGLLLEALETIPSQRKKGYASLLIRQVQEALAKEGDVKLYSHVNKRNIASLRTHEGCGFRICGDNAVYINGSVDFRSYTLCYEKKKSCIS